MGTIQEESNLHLFSPRKNDLTMLRLNPRPRVSIKVLNIRLVTESIESKNCIE